MENFDPAGGRGARKGYLLRRSQSPPLPRQPSLNHPQTPKPHAYITPLTVRSLVRSATAAAGIYLSPQQLYFQTVNP